MNIKDLIEEAGYTPKRKAATHGGEYCSPCPFCKEGNDRFLMWPQKTNSNGEYQGGRYSCRVCRKYGDAITLLIQLHNLSYPEACKRLNVQPRERNKEPQVWTKPKPLVAEDPTTIWQDKALVFVNWCHAQLLKNPLAMNLLSERGFNLSNIIRFKLGFNSGEKGNDIFRDREDWGLSKELKDNGRPRMHWLPVGLTVPSFNAKEQVIKVKVRRSAWHNEDKLPKYVEISGSKKTPSIYGNSSLPVALILESELDAMLVQQEAGDLVYCVALGGSSKSIDSETDLLLRTTKKILFLPDFDVAGAKAWATWKNNFSNIQRILTPLEKSAGDYLKVGGDLKKWISDCVNR